MDWSISEASNRFGTMLIVFGVLDYMTLHVFSEFQLQRGPTIGYLRVWRFGMVHNFGILKLVAIERGCETGLELCYS